MPSEEGRSRRPTNLRRAVGRVLIALTFKSRRGPRPSGTQAGRTPELQSKESLGAAVSTDTVCTTVETKDLEDKSATPLSSQRDSPASDFSFSEEGSGNDDDEEEEDGSQHQQLRERRKAIFDSKSLCIVSPLEDHLTVSPQDSCDETGGSGATLEERPRRRKKSSADLGMHYPGDLLSQARPRRLGRPLNSRNTIADFANTKAYQASTASLISAGEQDKKAKTSFSIMKLIDKKSHRLKDNFPELTEVLQNLKRSEFQDDFLTSFKGAHWHDLMEKGQDESTRSDPTITDLERKRREAVWELFTSEYVFLVDHLMALKHCFMEPLKQIQVEGCLMFAEPQDLFGNLDEVCSVSYTFCHEFGVLLLNEANFVRFGSSDILIQGLKRFCQLTKDGEVYHDYCLNYSKAMTYLEQLRKNEDFVEFEKWCEQDPRCKRLLLTDLLISPMQHCTKVPLLLNNICRYTENPEEQTKLMEALEQLETSLKNLEAKMNWLKNFERIQEIQQQIVWMSISELEPRAFIPEFLKPILNRQPCERLLTSPKRQLLHEGPLVLIEVSKTVDMYMFLFDDILLLTKIKKSPRKTKPASCDAPSYGQLKSQTEGAVFTVHRQPIALDRFTVHEIRQSESSGLWCHVAEPAAAGSGAAVGVYGSVDGHQRQFVDPFPPESFGGGGGGDDDDDDCSPHRSNLFLGCLSAAAVSCLRNAFVVVQTTRFQQVIGVYTLQAPSDAAKAAWMVRLPKAQDTYRRRHKPSTDAGDHVTGSPSVSSEFNEDAALATTATRHQHPSNTSSSPGSPRSPRLRPRPTDERAWRLGGGSASESSPRQQMALWGDDDDNHHHHHQQQQRRPPVFDFAHVVPPSPSDTEDPFGDEEEEEDDPFSVSRQVLCGSDTNSLSSWSQGGLVVRPRVSQYLSPPQVHDHYTVNSAREGVEALNRYRAKSLRVRHRPNLCTIREKSQSITTLHK